MAVLDFFEFSEGMQTRSLHAKNLRRSLCPCHSSRVNEQLFAVTQSERTNFRGIWIIYWNFSFGICSTEYWNRMNTKYIGPLRWIEAMTVCTWKIDAPLTVASMQFSAESRLIESRESGIRILESNSQSTIRLRMWFSVGFADQIVVGFVGLHKMPSINFHPENRLFYGRNGHRAATAITSLNPTEAELRLKLSVKMCSSSRLQWMYVCISTTDQCCWDNFGFLWLKSKTFLHAPFTRWPSLHIVSINFRFYRLRRDKAPTLEQENARHIVSSSFNTRAATIKIAQRISLS